MSKTTITRRQALGVITAGGVASAALGVAAQESTNTAPRSVDVVVIGAGAAGTNAARLLMDAGKDVVLLEANDRVGGRLKRGEIGGQTIDLGGQWVGPSQTRAMEITKELGLETYPTFYKGAMLVEAGTGEFYKGLTALPAEIMGEYLALIKLIDGSGADIPLDAPWSAARATEWDGMTAETWFAQVAKTDAMRNLLRVVVEVVFSVPPSQLSVLAFLHYIKSGNGFNDITGTQRGAQQDLYTNGFVSIPEKLAAMLGDRLILGAPVSAIAQHDAGVTVHSAKGTFECARVVVCVPPPAAATIRFTPELPYQRRGLMQRMPMGAVIKCFLAYETPFWREDRLNGQSVMASTEFGTTFDITQPDNPRGILCGFFDGAPAMRWADKSPEERRARVIEDVVTAFGPKARNPIDYKENNWPRETWSIGGYTSIPTPGTLTAFGAALREPCGRVHWAGTETSDVWTGYVDGALRSGDRVADEVLRVL